MEATILTKAPAARSGDVMDIPGSPAPFICIGSNTRGVAVWIQVGGDLGSRKTEEAWVKAFSPHRSPWEDFNGVFTDIGNVFREAFDPFFDNLLNEFRTFRPNFECDVRLMSDDRTPASETQRVKFKGTTYEGVWNADVTTFTGSPMEKGHKAYTAFLDELEHWRPIDEGGSKS